MIKIIRILAVIFLLLARTSWAAVTFDAAGTQLNGASLASPQTLSFTISGSANFVVAVVALSSSVTSVAATWNSVSMTSIGTATTGTMTLYMFGLASPATGTQTLSVSWSGGTSGMSLQGVSYIGVNTSGPTANFQGVNNTGIASSFSGGGITSATGHRTFEATATISSVTTVQGGTEVSISSLNTGTYGMGVSDAPGASGAVAMGWGLSPSNPWAAVGVDIVAPTGASGGGYLPELGVGQ